MVVFTLNKMNNKNCIISFANKNGNYAKGLARLSDSLRNNFDGDFLAWTHENSLGAPLHIDNPYAFKIYAFEKAINAGYQNILWLDSSCFAIKNIQPIFEHIETNGYIMQDAGHYVGTWTNDKALEYFRMSRDEAMNIKCYGNAGLLGLNFNNYKAESFFDAWHSAMQCGLFKGNWYNENKTESNDQRCLGHRHDLSCGSILAYRNEMQLQPGDQWLQYAGIYDETLNNNIYFKAQGI